MDTTDIKQQGSTKRWHPLATAAAIGATAVGLVGAATLLDRQVATDRQSASKQAVASTASKSTGAAGRSAGSSPSPTRSVAAPCADCGVVVAIRSVKVPGEGTGVGVVAGGVVGGVIGNQIGGGSGRDAARVIGAIGGAVAGHEIEKQARSSLRYQVDVRLDSGATRTLNLATAPAVGVGERVRIDGGAVRPA